MLDRPGRRGHSASPWRLTDAGADEVVLARLPGDGQLYPRNRRGCAACPSWRWTRPPRCTKRAGRRRARRIPPTCRRARSICCASGRFRPTRACASAALRREPEGAPLELEGDVVRSDPDGGGRASLRAAFSSPRCPTATRRAAARSVALGTRGRCRSGGYLRIDVRGAFDQASDFVLLEQRICRRGVARGLSSCATSTCRAVRQITS